ncbi:MAG: hypothetical protein VCC00_03270 [Deltaproteobacteria bacterium]
MKNLRKHATKAVLFAVVLSASACGSGAGNNDQGIVFTATGIWRGPASIEDGQIRCTEPNISNAIVDTSNSLSLSLVTAFPDRFNAFADPCGGYIGLENKLLTLAINVQTIAIEYNVPGAAVDVPDHAVPTGFRINPSSSTTEATSGVPNLVYAELVGQLVPATIVDFLTIYANQLPQRPYLMTATLVAVGQAQNGDHYRSNPVSYSFTVED